ncbi:MULTISPECIES: PorP/SprF family type IX secretion system membrane protein [Hymenobacter]|uniref:Type IX secretion system membrane protein PorP/SprF n=1 Tax=Hymenobacter jejuensis TaxID=2502781 RepID=A0A5B8A5U1_9BACT|nr:MULTISPECIES: type IX secretion system membrane protein PorP/SprF [Hymenobacter]MBC6989971.1 type IX secretion system membrane protein PorP/SprF [Hymenobacter sp. BT491]QDA62005.1 type IX secretion system membrane protein PorP/SprF [Hymenobacter jejuensis]
MKRSLILLLLPLLLAAAPALAQQQAQYSQYMNNNYILNPGATGVEDYIDVKFSYRTQWTGLEGAPKTYYASISSSLGKWRTTSKRTLRDRRRPFHALGALVYNDVTGPTSRKGAYVSYAYNMVLRPNLRAALGVSAGMQQFAVDGQMLHFFDPTTQAASSASRVLDGSVGLWVYSSDFYVGVSGAQLLANKLDFSYGSPNGVDAGENSLKRHYFATAGVRVPLSKDWSLVPSVLVKAVNPAPLSVDLNAKLKYQDLLWAGVSWRAFDSVVAMVGFSYEQLTLGYSYDAGISGLSGYHGGSHEVLLGLRLKKKAQVVCTNRFW